MSRKWKLPPRIKIFEAIGCLGDQRIIVRGNRARVRSSSGHKYYDVTYGHKHQTIMSNDNGSYWQGYLGYPAIAFLMRKKVIKYDPQYCRALARIPWKEINTRTKNDYKKTEAEAIKIASKRGISKDDLMAEVDYIYKQIRELSLKIFGIRIKPPSES